MQQAVARQNLRVEMNLQRLYASAVAALSSLMQSVGRERVANSVRESTAPEPTPTTGQSDYQNAAPGPGCGGDMR